MSAKLLRSLRVRPGSSITIADYDTRETFGWDKESAKAELAEVIEKIDVLQYRLFGEGRRSVLLVIQAMDAAGKDGTIRSILSGLNPAGISVAAFKAPGGEETQHDYLWRVHEKVPGKGMIGIFNRSHYEEVLVVRVKKFVAATVWRKRYRHINEFERMLSDEGTRIVKIFLNVSKDEQAQRFQDRLDDPEKRWKFRAGDLDDRKLWAQFMKAFEDAISQTSTTYAPWYVVPADRNWVRNLVVAKILLATLEDIDPKLPDPEDGLDDIVIQ